MLRIMEDELRRKTAEVERFRCETEEYQRQIDAATKKGLDAFDGDKFGKKRRKKREMVG